MSTDKPNGWKEYSLRDAMRDFKDTVRDIVRETAPKPKTVQVFPRGDMVTYSGEYPHYRDANGAEFPPDEQKRIQSHLLAESWIERDVYCNQSSLVESLISEERDGFTADDITGIYRDFSESTVEECREYLRDIGEDEPDENPWTMNREQLAELLADAGIEVYDSESVETILAAVVANINDETIDGLKEWREAANECASDNPQEVYQWFAVSGWLHGELEESGQPTIDNEFGYWWGRTCCGQSIIMDGTLQEIALRILSK